MSEVAAVSIDDLMQVLAAFFGEWKSALLLVRSGQEGTQRTAVAAGTRQFVRTPVVGRLLRGLSGAVFQLVATRAEPV